MRDFISVAVLLKKTKTKGVVEFIAKKQLTTPNWPLTNPTCSFNRALDWPIGTHCGAWIVRSNQPAIDGREILVSHPPQRFPSRKWSPKANGCLVAAKRTRRSSGGGGAAVLTPAALAIPQPTRGEISALLTLLTVFAPSRCTLLQWYFSNVRSYYPPP
jgi:hypothetical protein